MTSREYSYLLHSLICCSDRDAWNLDWFDFIPFMSNQIMGSLWLLFRVLRHFEILWIHAGVFEFWFVTSLSRVPVPWTVFQLISPIGPHICVSESGQHWFRWWRVAYSAPSHYLNQCWVIVTWTLRNKRRWNFNQNTKRFVHENASENVVFEMAAILSRGRRVNPCPVEFILENRDSCKISFISQHWDGIVIWNMFSRKTRT